MKILTGDVLGIPHMTFGTTWDGRVVSSMHQPHFSTKEIPRYSFLFEDERTPGLPNLDRADIWGAYWELNPKPPILHHSALTRLYYITQFTNHILFTVPLSWSTWSEALPCNTHRKEVTLRLCIVFFTLYILYWQSIIIYLLRRGYKPLLIPINVSYAAVAAVWFK